jgi:hypothetical protein
MSLLIFFREVGMRGLWLFGMVVVLLAGCGEDADPTRPNDFVPLTAIEIVPPYPNQILVKHTAGQFQAIGHYSGVFTRDVTAQVEWSSQNESGELGFQPSRPGWGEAGASGSVVVHAALGGMQNSLELTISDEVISQLALAPNPANLVVDEVKQLRAAGTFSAGTVQDVTEQVLWSISDLAIASIEATPGATKALAVGSADITASYPDSTVAETISLTVSPSIRISAPFSILTINETAQLTAIAKYSATQEEDITLQATWISASPAVATVGQTGLVTGVGLGNVNIRAEMGTSSGSTALAVDSVSSIAVTPENEILLVGESLQMKAVATFASGGTRDITSLADWSTTTSSTFIFLNNTAPDKGVVFGLEVGSNAPVRAAWRTRIGQTTISVRQE